MAIISRKQTKQPIPATEKDFIVALGLLPENQKRFEVLIPNAFVSAYHEADLLGLRRSGFIDEFEIKLSKRDFLADRNKTLEFDNQGQRFKLAEMEKGNLLVNHFWYVLPMGVVHSDDIPSFAGIIEISDKVKIVRHPKRLHSRKADYATRYKLATKMNTRYWKMVSTT